MWRFIERKLNEARQQREGAEKRAKELAAAPHCRECGGDGEVRVRGVRSPSGYEMCYCCAGTGKDLDQRKEAGSELRTFVLQSGRILPR